MLDRHTIVFRGETHRPGANRELNGMRFRLRGRTFGEKWRRRVDSRCGNVTLDQQWLRACNSSFPSRIGCLPLKTPPNLNNCITRLPRSMYCDSTKETIDVNNAIYHHHGNKTDTMKLDGQHI